MKNTLIKKIGGMVLVVLMVAAFAQVRVFAQDFAVMEENKDVQKQQDVSAPSDILIGVWQTVITPQNCLTGSPVAPSFSGLLTFNESGTLAETAAGTSPALRSPGHGVWRRGLGERDYYMRFMFYRFDAAGNLIGSQKVTQTVEFDPKTNKTYSTGTVEVIDLNGNVLGRGCAVSTATRFE